MTQQDTKQNSYRTEHDTNRHEYDAQPSGAGQRDTERREYDTERVGAGN